MIPVTRMAASLKLCVEPVIPYGWQASAPWIPVPIVRDTFAEAYWEGMRLWKEQSK